MNIAIKNKSAEKRKAQQILIADPPILLQDCEVDGVFSEYQGYGMYKFETYVGLSLSAYAAVWDLTDGPQTLLQGWWDLSTESVILTASISGSTPSVLQITPELNGHYITYYETAVRDNVSRYASSLDILVRNDSSAPVFRSLISSISGSHKSGATLIKANYEWVSQVGLSTVKGSWYKNNIDTGISLSSYSNTTNGDTLFWAETAYDILGKNSIFAPIVRSGYGQSNTVNHYVNDNLYYVLSGIKNSVNTRISGLSGGETYMKVFSTKTPTPSSLATYTRNLSLWANSIVDKLQPCVVYKDPAGLCYESFGGVLITPRHVLYCRHAYPHAEGTWGFPTGPIIIRFVKSDNTIINTIQLHQYELLNADLCVALLDTNVQSLGIDPMPIFPYNSLQLDTLKALSLSAFPAIGMSQGYGRDPNQIPDAPFSNYTAKNDIMLYIKDLYNTGRTTVTNPYSAFNYGVYGGDSGTPAMILYNDAVYLYQILTAQPWAGWRVSDYINDINLGIAAADALAISLGRLSTPTGYTIQPAIL